MIYFTKLPFKDFNVVINAFFNFFQINSSSGEWLLALSPGHFSQGEGINALSSGGRTMVRFLPISIPLVTIGWSIGMEVDRNLVERS